MNKQGRTVIAGNFFFKYRSYLFVPILILLIIFTKPRMPFNSAAANNFLNILGFIFALLGFLVRVIVIGYKRPGTSGRGTNIDVKEVVTDGAYLTCRNPLYFANFLMWLGLTIIWWQLWFFIVITGWFAVEYYFIIKAEESYLSGKFGAAYDDYKKSVRAFFPLIKKFKRPDRPFNWNKVLKNETNLLLLILVFPPLFSIYEGQLWDMTDPSKNAVLLLAVSVIAAGWIVLRYNLYYREKILKENRGS